MVMVTSLIIFTVTKSLSILERFRIQLQFNNKFTGFINRDYKKFKLIKTVVPIIEKSVSN